jgi:hypothetical protein
LMPLRWGRASNLVSKFAAANRASRLRNDAAINSFCRG